LISLASMYALYLRPAALFVLAAYVCVGVLIGLQARFEIRRRVLLSAGSCFLGMVVAYLSWSYRNYNVFGSFQYSTVSGYNLLHFNARGMEPYLDQTGRERLQSAMAKYPTFLQRYNGADQFTLSNRQGEEGVRIIVQYPMAFLLSHMKGVVTSFFVFSPSVVKSQSSVLLVAASILHSGLALIGISGLVASWKSFSETQRVALSLMLAAGIVSSLTGGALFSPRFRIPLDVLLAVGCALFVMGILRKRDSHGIVDGKPDCFVC